MANDLKGILSTQLSGVYSNLSDIKRDIMINSGPNIVTIATDMGDRALEVGPPTCIYCKSRDGGVMKVLIKDGGTKIVSNDILKTPDHYVIELDIPYYELSITDDAISTAGTLVYIGGLIEEVRKKLDATPSNLLMGQTDSGSASVTEIANGDGKVLIGDKGDVQVVGKDGKQVASFSGDAIVEQVPKNDTRMPEQNKHVIFKESLLGNILPKAFIPPFNLPILEPTFGIIVMTNRMVSELIKVFKD